MTVPSRIDGDVSFLRSFFEEQSSLSMAVLDEGRNILDCNAGFRMMVGETDMPLGRNIREYLTPASRKKLEEIPPSEIFRRIRLDFQSRNAAVFATRCHFFDAGGSVVLLCERSLLSSDEYIAKMMVLTGKIQEHRERLARTTDGN